MKTTTIKSISIMIGISMATATFAQIVTGSGTNNFITKFTTTGSIVGNSQIQDNATNVGIGYAGSYKLDINGDLNAGGSSTATTNAFRLGTNSILWHNGNTADIFVGVGAGNASMTGHNNAFLGNNAGNANAAGHELTFVGFEAGKKTQMGIIIQPLDIKRYMKIPINFIKPPSDIKLFILIIKRLLLMPLLILLVDINRSILPKHTVDVLLDFGQPTTTPQVAVARLSVKRLFVTI